MGGTIRSDDARGDGDARRFDVSEAHRARAPWIVWPIEIVLVAATAVLASRNRIPDDQLWVPAMITMVAGYSTVGALLVSRGRSNAIGWLLISVSLTLLFAVFSVEYIRYAYVTDPGSLPAGSALAVVSNSFWLSTLVAIILFALLFPTGRVPGPRWRPLPWAIVGLAITATVAGVLYPGPVDIDLKGVELVNPIGVEGLKSLLDVVATLCWIGIIMVGAPLSIIAMVLRHRRSFGEERQQLRWLVYVATTTGIVIAVSGALAIIFGESFGDSPPANVLFLVTVALIGIGVPVAVGIAVMRYRLYDLDLVVKKTVLYAAVAALLVAVFAVVAVVVGAIAGKTTTGAVVAAGAIGVVFWPALRVARRLADRIVYGRRATPYQVLTEFTTRVGGSYVDEDVLPRMAQILRDAVGAQRATVWLDVGGILQPVAAAPEGGEFRPVVLSGGELPRLEADAAVEVRDRGDLLGALAVSMPANDPITPARERLVRDLAGQAGLVLRNVRLIEELRASRQRLVAAQDEERRRLERNLHDGAQQQLVALQVKQRLAEAVVDRDPAKARALLAQLQADTAAALDDLRDLARGIYPPLLADKGLVTAVEAQARRAAIPVEVDGDGVGRYDQHVEAAVYFCVLEALQNAAKYSEAGGVSIRLEAPDGVLAFRVSDDGRGFDAASTTFGTGLKGMADRLEAIGGTLEVSSAPDRGTTLTGRVPI
jgi:signal transduction histidine kinase